MVVNVESVAKLVRGVGDFLRRGARHIHLDVHAAGDLAGVRPSRAVHGMRRAGAHNSFVDRLHRADHLHPQRPAGRDRHGRIGIVADRERLNLPRLEIVISPNLGDRILDDPYPRSRRPHTPVRRPVGRALLHESREGQRRNMSGSTPRRQGQIRTDVPAAVDAGLVKDDRRIEC